MTRFNSRRNFLRKTLTMSLGVGYTAKLSVLDEVLLNTPNEQLQKEDMKSLMENSPQLACNGKFGDGYKEGCCAADFPGPYQCYDKK